MRRNIFLNKKWQLGHLKKVKERAGNRYTPELNVNLPISEIFDGLSRTEDFYISIRKHYGKLNRDFRRVSLKYENKELQKIYKNLWEEMSRLLKLLYKLKEYTTRKIPWVKINKRTQRTIEFALRLSGKLREEKDKVDQQKTDKEQIDRHSVSERLSTDIHYLYEALKELRYFRELASSTKSHLSNSPFLLLTGTAGTGKTHLLCDVIEGRIIGKKSSPAVLLFGELFETTEDSLQQIIQQLGLRYNKRRFLSQLNNAGKHSRCHAIIAIDALNETRLKNFWKRNLSRLAYELKKYPNIALVISVRTGFEREVIPQTLRRKFVQEQHRGFEFREWEAVNKFFNEFSIPLPEIPLLLPEFREPLFLLLFCAAFGKKNKDLSMKSKSQLKKIKPFRGHIGATHIFESFIKQAADKIATDFKLPKGKKQKGEYVIWDTIIKKIAERMVEKIDSRVSEEEVLAIVRKAYPAIDHNRFLNELERNLLLEKISRYSIEKQAYDGFDFRFPFQKFSDHLIGRYFFKKYEVEFGKHNKNLTTAKRFFSKRRKLGKFLSKSWNRGIVEALSIQCPEHLRGSELVEAAPYLRGSNVAQEAFIESLIRRKIDAFSVDQKNTIDYINTEIIRTESGHHNLLNAFLAVAQIPNHPFNADFLHKHLSKFSMARRDSWWSTFLHYQHGEKGAIDRLIEWGWSEQDKTHINDDAIRLCSVALGWFLTTPNRFLRDKATKALVALLTNRLHVVLALLKQFKEVNDPYVIERLYAIAYGCAIRTRKDKYGLKMLSKWVYENIFRQGKPPEHILLRDYARGIIEVALHERLELQVNRKKIKPPFNSNWPKQIPSEKLLKKKYYPKDFFQKRTEERGFLDIWSSVMYSFGSLADFGRYVLNSAVDHWSGRRLNNRRLNRKILFNHFKNKLTKSQKELLEKATNHYFGIELSEILKSVRIVYSDEKKSIDEEKIKQQKKDQKKEMKQTLIKFKNTLSVQKRKFFDKEIKPFLNKRGDIDDPLERFDTGLAQRWVFDRVVQLGWSHKLHGKFDRYVNYSRLDRSEHKAERIGKKYQWIALHELLAKISDNFEFKVDSWSDRIGKYEGPWQLNMRDIDPSCILKEFPNAKPEGVPNFRDIEKQSQYNAWNKRISDSTWIKKEYDLPDPKQIIEVIDSQGNAWLVLEGFIEWQDETPPEHEKYNLSRRRLWYMMKSYLVKKREKNKVCTWAQREHFRGQWMPESHEFYHVYLGEYPWAPAFLYHYIPYYHHDGWTSGTGDKKIPAKVLVTDDKYLSRGSSIDCSTNETIGVKLPAKFILDKMNLIQNYIDGRFFDKKGDLVAFDLSVFCEDIPKCILIRKDKLSDFLKCKGYALFWTLLGEKNMIGGNVIGQPLGWLVINGTYTLDDKDKIVGTKRSHFKKSR
ncbi:MAG: ATP-binding protein [Candidatus Omnitrophota bacterium]|nr:MAG: ATP-binding protein [Candidatus Omnitrophota bacterium]